MGRGGDEPGRPLSLDRLDGALAVLTFNRGLVAQLPLAEQRAAEIRCRHFPGSRRARGASGEPVVLRVVR